jgi:hypothetical protein
MNREQTLRMSEPGRLERSILNGREQPIVLLGTPEQPGLVVRERNIRLTAESRWPWNLKNLPCSGWNQSVQSLAATLHLPPGYTALAVAGADRATSTWLGSWSLLDIFLVLVLAVAAGRVCGLWSGLALLAFLTLGHDLAGAPVLLWAPVLLATALLKFASSGPDTALRFTFRRILRGAYILCILALTAAAIPFLAQQMRTAMYPQLERPQIPTGPVRHEEIQTAAPQAPTMPTGSRSKKLMDSMVLMEENAAGDKRASADLESDPASVVQTGPGMPNWSWNSLVMHWNGPVDPEQTIRLWIMGPTLTRLARIAACLLFLAALGLMLRKKFFRPDRSGFTFAAGLCLLGLLAQPAPLQAQAFPDQDMLNRLRTRLLEPESCPESCLGIPLARLKVDGETLCLNLETHAQRALVLPLPHISPEWEPDSVRTDSEPAVLVRKEGKLWLFLNSGIHQIEITGPSASDLLEIQLPVQPKKLRIQAPGWQTMGVDENGRPQKSIRLTRLQTGENQNLPEKIPVPPFCEVRRILQLGIEWNVRTTVSRRSPDSAPILLPIPLLPGESVLSPGLDVQKDAVLVSLNPGQQSLSWNSRLERAPRIELKAPAASSLRHETWELSASPIWRVSMNGLDPVSLDTSEVWRPVWKPLPDEILTLAVTRPAPAPGPSLTVDHVTLIRSMGQKSENISLSMNIRAAKAHEQMVRIPDNARDPRLTDNGRLLPAIPDQNGTILIPVSPGVHRVDLHWRTDAGQRLFMYSPKVNVGSRAANVNLETTVPENRWILFCLGGPPLGPAVLFWSYLALCLLAAAALSRMPWTPLRTRQWFLLGMGLSQISPGGAILAVVWLPAFGLRRRFKAENRFIFNAGQILLWLLFAAGMAALYLAVEKGLLGTPDMQITGNGSYDHFLRWTQDRINGTLPVPTIVSVPVWVYRSLMLIWSLWLAWSLVNWIRWAVRSWSEEKMWMKALWPRPKNRTAKKH